MATYKIYDHPLRSKMIRRLCVEIYEINPDNIPDSIEQKLCFMTYQEIIKPLVNKEFNAETSPAEVGIKYCVSAQVIRGLLGIKV